MRKLILIVEEDLMRRYYLHTRKGIYYAEMVSPEGRKLTARSTGKKTEDEALLVVTKWLEEGLPIVAKRKIRPVEKVGLEDILKVVRKAELNSDEAMHIVAALKDRGLIDVSVTKKSNEAGHSNTTIHFDETRSFIEFLEEFWNYDISPYVREKKVHGHSIGKRHCYESTNRVRRYYKPVFQDNPLNAITRHDLKEFSITLKDKGFSASSVNKILITGTTALSWAWREGFLSVDPTVGLARFSGETKKRGVLTPQEAEAVFKVKWKDPRSYTGNLLSLTTGLRSGEVLAIRKSDIDEKVLHVRHSWSCLDGLKSPKNGEKRKVPLLPEIREKLMDLLRQNPHQNDEPFIFYGQMEDKPMDQKILIKGLKIACAAAGIDAAARGIVFHSHRHYYAARMSDKMTADQIIRITGHKSRAVFDEYADHLIDENLAVMASAAAETFEKILHANQ